MPNNHVKEVLDNAKNSLQDWIDENDYLCDLKRSDFNQGFPYDVNHLQDLYILRYYAAYFFETYDLYKRIKEDGLNEPLIISLGCGNMVDAAAAKFVFDKIWYHGYDLNDWHLKAVETDDEVEFDLQNVFEEEDFYPDVDIFMFSKSIGDIGAQVGSLKPIVEATAFNSDVLYVCASYRASDGGIENDRNKMNTFVSYFDGYQSEVLYNFEGESEVENGNFRSAWIGHLGTGKFSHPWYNYCGTILNSCQKKDQNCPSDECTEWINRKPILNMNELSYEIMKLSRI